MENQHENLKGKIVNLIKKLYTKLHNAKITKKIASLVLACATVVTISSCDLSNVFQPDDNTTNTENNGNNNENNNQKEIDWDEYSQILEDVCTDDYYVDLLRRARTEDSYLYETGEFAPHPYAFLLDEGFDIQSIKNNSTEAYTTSYVLNDEPNNLYINTRVLQNDYYVSYHLKYELTDEEMQDYQMLHNGYYTQALFINNVISETREPSMVEKSQIKKELYERMANFLGEWDLVSTQRCNIIITNPNLKEHTFDAVILPAWFDTYENMSYRGNVASTTFLTDLRMSGDTITSYSVLVQDEIVNKSAKIFLPQEFSIKKIWGFDVQR